jgi:DNA-binding XRE family transcriptional regulator
MLVKPRMEIEGRRYVVLEETEYERLCQATGQALERDELPSFPKPDRRGRFPAVEYARVSLARDLIRDRRALGLSQQQLARLAKVRQETISRLETGKHSADPRTVDKLCDALDAVRGSRARKKNPAKGSEKH